MSIALRRRTRPRSRPAVESLDARTLLSVGGGFAAAGIQGDYFANTTLSGAPAFSRRDVRIDFNWGTSTPVGGSTAPGYAAVRTSAFSARWSGEIIPNFSETYNLIATADDGARLMIRPTGTTAWTTLVNDWAPHGPRDDIAPYAMVAGRSYDVVMEYEQLGGAASARLSWSSPSTPREVIDPLGTTGINAVTYVNTVFADAMKASRAEWGDPTGYATKPKVAVDADGWPLADAQKVVWEGRDAASTAGTYLLQFQGKAKVLAIGNAGVFSVAGRDYGATLPSGVGYDPATNTTTALYRTAGTAGLNVNFTDTQRTASAPLHSGITQVKMMRPTAPGASTYQPLGTLFDPAAEAAFAEFTTERWLTANFDTAQVNWSDRSLPSGQEAAFAGRNEVWEYLVMLANETGKDLYITIPMNASQDYVTKLAQLIRYGSDGVNPYASPQASPAYPGLNPNLKLYVEWGNENWNWAFSQAGAGLAASQQAVRDNTPEGQIINFDGAATAGDFRRWTALKIVEASNAFRSVYGDAAMGDRVRPLLEYQYADGQNTATTALKFIDDYFNNGDGVRHVATPHPVSYFLWGAGGAAYYNAANPHGYQTEVNFADPGFEAVQANPGDDSDDQGEDESSWTFTGDAGVYADANYTSASPVQALGPIAANTGGSQFLGYKFTVGASDLGVYQLGRWVAAGNTRAHSVTIVRASDRVAIATASVSTTVRAAGGYAYAALPRPVVLKANTTYYLVSSEADGQDAFYGPDTQFRAQAGITIDGAATARGSGASTNWAFADGPSGAVGYGPVDLKFLRVPAGRLGLLNDAPQGLHAAYLGSGGSISQSVYFPEAGVFALEVSAAVKDGAAGQVRIYVDGVEATPNGLSYKPGTAPWVPGGGIAGVDNRNFNALGTLPFSITAPGYHTIRFVGVGPANTFAYFDDMKVTSVDAIFDGGVPGKAGSSAADGLAAYQDQLKLQATYAQAYGLHVVAYEGGWALGGDTGANPLMNYAKYVDPRAALANRASLDAFARSGGALYVLGSYEQWPMLDTANAENYPLLKSVVQANAAAPPAAVNGMVLPPGPRALSLLQSNATYTSTGMQVNKLAVGGMMTWNIVVTQAGTYTLSMGVGSGGTGVLTIDDARVVGAGSSATLSGRVALTAGVHVVKIKARGARVPVLGGTIALS